LGQGAIPSPIVEILSDSTRRRDRGQKRDFDMEVGVVEYWMVDAGDRSITGVRAAHADAVVRESLTWSPAGVSAPLTFALTKLFE
jgi:Uma2 family endonuclease